MAFLEVCVNEIKEVLRAWLAGAGLRTAAERAGVDRKTARRYVEAGLARDGGEAWLTDELIGAVVLAVRPARATGHGTSWEVLVPWREQISAWAKADPQLTNVHGKLERRGVLVPYRALHRFATEQCDFGGKRITLPVADGKPGAEYQIDFGRLGLMHDPAAAGRCTR